MLIKVWLGVPEGEEQPKLVKASVTNTTTKGTSSVTVLEVGSEKDEKAVQEAQFTLRPGEKLMVEELRPEAVYDPEQKTAIEGEWPTKEQTKKWEEWDKKEAEKRAKANKERIERLLHPAPPEEELETVGSGAGTVGGTTPKPHVTPATGHTTSPNAPSVKK